MNNSLNIAIIASRDARSGKFVNGQLCYSHAWLHIHVYIAIPLHMLIEAHAKKEMMSLRQRV